MKIGSTGNNNVAFGSFRVVMGSEKVERETFGMLFKEIKKVYPETQIKHDQSHQARRKSGSSIICYGRISSFESRKKTGWKS